MVVVAQIRFGDGARILGVLALLGQVRHAAAVMRQHGVTRFLPTIISSSAATFETCARTVLRANDAAIAGIHVEGPHISPEDGARGAHPKEWVRRPDIEEFRRWQDAAQGQVRIVTLSPEWPEAPRYIEKVVEAGVVASIGHTAANAGQIADAVAAGATLSTHLGNGAHSVLPRHPNYLWDQLAEDRLAAGLIVDGIHLPAAFLKVALRAKGIARCVLVTDASTPSGCAPGRYVLGTQAVELTPGGHVVLEGTNRLAGSALRMDRGIENLMKLAGIGLADAVRMATVNAACIGRVPGRTGGVVPGDRADLVLFDFDPQTKQIAVRATYLDGQRVH